MGPTMAKGKMVLPYIVKKLKWKEESKEIESKVFFFFFETTFHLCEFAYDILDKFIIIFIYF